MIFLNWYIGNQTRCFRNAKEVYINSENEEELLEYISEEYNKPEKITKVKLRVLLGDGELSLYKGFLLEKKTVISDSSPLFDYVLEYGIENTYKYILTIFISIIGLFICKINFTRRKSLWKNYCSM